MLLKAAWAGWHDIAVEMRFEKMKSNFAQMKNRGQESSRRMLQMMLGSQGELVVKSTFTGWHEYTNVQKQQREIDRVKDGMKKDSTHKMLTMLVGAQDDVLKKVTFAGWKEYIAELRQQRAAAEIQRSLREKGAESSKRMLGMLLGSQAEALIKATFASWVDVVVTGKMERLREASSKMRNKEQESQRRMLSMLAGSQGSLVLKTSFSAWSECIYE